MTLSRFLFTPKGLVDPVWCKNNKWTIEKAAITKGIKKCKVKNRVNVALSTANPPHSQKTMSPPTYGIAEKRLVITVAPQKDIWPQGRT